MSLSILSVFSVKSCPWDTKSTLGLNPTFIVKLNFFHLKNLKMFTCFCRESQGLEICLKSCHPSILCCFVCKMLSLTCSGKKSPLWKSVFFLLCGQRQGWETFFVCVCKSCLWDTHRKSFQPKMLKMYMGF